MQREIAVPAPVLVSTLIIVLGAGLVAGSSHAETLTVTDDLAVWLDAGDIDGDGQPDSITDGTDVGLWVNRTPVSAVGNATTATEQGGTAPRYQADGGSGFNNRPVVDFTTSDDRNRVGLYLDRKYGIGTTYTPEPGAMTLLVVGFLTLLIRRGTRIGVGKAR